LAREAATHVRLPAPPRAWRRTSQTRGTCLVAAGRDRHSERMHRSRSSTTAGLVEIVRAHTAGTRSDTARGRLRRPRLTLPRLAPRIA
jgi:hypothetical protein